MSLEIVWWRCFLNRDVSVNNRDPSIYISSLWNNDCSRPRGYYQRRLSDWLEPGRCVSHFAFDTTWILCIQSFLILGGFLLVVVVNCWFFVGFCLHIADFRVSCHWSALHGAPYLRTYMRLIWHLLDLHNFDIIKHCTKLRSVWQHLEDGKLRHY